MKNENKSTRVEGRSATTCSARCHSCGGAQGNHDLQTCALDAYQTRHFDDDPQYCSTHSYHKWGEECPECESEPEEDFYRRAAENNGREMI